MALPIATTNPLSIQSGIRDVMLLPSISIQNKAVLTMPV